MKRQIVHGIPVFLNTGELHPGLSWRIFLLTILAYQLGGGPYIEYIRGYTLSEP
jgi:hypothetical protein